MNEQAQVQAFFWSCSSIQEELTKTYTRHSLSNTETALETGSWELIRNYVKQFDDKTRTDAARMSHHYKLFYMLENEIRDFVSSILEDAFQNDWWEKQVPPPVKANATKNRNREIAEGVTVRSDREIDYINFGELGEVIKTNWDVFGGIFSNSSVSAVEKVMARLNMLRNYIAHCSSFGDDEILRLRLTIRDWFRLME